MIVCQQDGSNFQKPGVEYLLPVLKFVDGHYPPPTSNLGDNYVLINYGTGIVDKAWGDVPYNSWVTKQETKWAHIYPNPNFHVQDTHLNLTMYFNGTEWLSTPGDTTIQELVEGAPYMVFSVQGSRRKKATKSYLESNNLFTNIVPILIPRKMRLDSISVATEGAFTWVAEVHIDGVAVPEASLTLTGEAEKIMNNVNVVIEAGARLSLYVNGDNIEKPRILLTFKN
jgi:hypothetical protein